jgi:hypothetical protein
VSLELYLDPDVVPLTVRPVAGISDYFLVGSAEDHDLDVATLNESCNYILKLQLHLVNGVKSLFIKDLKYNGILSPVARVRL